MSQREYELLVRFRVPMGKLVQEHTRLMGGVVEGIIADPKDLMYEVIQNTMYEGARGVRLSGTFVIIEARRVETI